VHPGRKLNEKLTSSLPIDPFLGVFDCFSATVAAKYSGNLFVSGFGMAASFYGLPDVGYISWSDMVQAAWRIRQILPKHLLLVDIDDGYVDVHTACHVVRQLDNMGAAMVMLEDQSRPRRCGHADGKQVLPLDRYLEKLSAVLQTRENIRVLARTDASGDEIFRRVDAISETDADVLMVDGIDSLETLLEVRKRTDKPLLFNQIAGGKSPRLSLSDLRSAGVGLVQYSTPLLFAAQSAMISALDTLFANDGVLPDGQSTDAVGMAECTALLEGNVLPNQTEPDQPKSRILDFTLA
jgi:2-methylisocitrate lyase-like PEP mutase family enzyme